VKVKEESKDLKREEEEKRRMKKEKA